MKEIVWDEKKNDLLKRTRGVSFEEAELLIKENAFILDIDHFNKALYPKQKIFILLINNYIYLVPYELKEDVLVLKTIYPSRRFNKLLNDKNE